MRKLAWFCGGFGAACLLFCAGAGGLAAAAVCALLLLFALLVKAVSGHTGAFFQVSRRAAALLLGAALAFLWSAAYSALFRAPALKLAGTEQTVTATVLTCPENTSIGGRSFAAELEGVDSSPHALFYVTADWAGLLPGDQFTCTARFRSADTLYGEETTYYSAKGVFLLAYCDEAPASVTRPDRLPLRFLPSLCARRLQDSIDTVFDGDVAPLAAAVTLGDRDGLSPTLSSDLTRAGISHAAVVSGMHISFLVSFFLLLFPGRRPFTLCLIPLLLFYALMAGGTPSAMRAVIMQAALLTGPIFRRQPDPPTSLGLALLILLIHNPFAAAGASLQLSFAAVAGILLVSFPLSAALMSPIERLCDRDALWARPLRAICRFVAVTLSTTLGALLFTTPITVLRFGSLTLLAPLTNLLTLWAVTLLMVGTLLVGTLALLLPGLMVYPAALVSLPARWIITVVTAVGGSPAAAVDGTRPLFLVWLAALYLTVPLVLFARRRGRALLLAAVCLTGLLGCAVALHAVEVHRADLTVTALDVGQGSSTLLMSGGSAILVDCGGNSARDPGDVAADRLGAMGRTYLDALVFTHLDEDHFNGALLLFRRLKIGSVWLPDTDHDPAALSLLLTLAEQEGAEVHFVETTETVPLGEASLTLYPPMGGGSSNEEGLFVLCSHGDFDVLITGDADSFVESMLVKYCPIPDIELLLAGHHGSRHSTSQLLLDTLRPELAVISVGYNSYGHPAQEALDRLRSSGAAIYRTDTFGTVTVTVRDGVVSIH